jgi:hypothetical protein
MQQTPAAPPDMSASVKPEEAVITVKGVCPAKPAAAKGAAAAKTATAAKTPAADCKTVITKADQGEQEMSKLADALRARAAAGEEFVKLQKEAFDAAGMKIDSPTVNLPKVRRTGLPPGHAAAFDLKAGEVSPVINDSGGHYIYKVISKDRLTLDQAKDEIHSTLQNQRTKEMTDAVQKSFTSETNEKYFGPPGPAGGVPPRRIPNPRMPPSPTSPPAAQPPASQPN